MDAECFRDFYFVSGEKIDQLQGVNNAFRFEMIVGDDKRRPGVFRHVFDAFRPGFELCFGIQIVVALGGRAKPDRR